MSVLQTIIVKYAIKQVDKMTELNKKQFISKLNSVFSENGLSSLLTLEKSEKFFTLTEFMLSENEKYNLTAITEPDKIILNHYADCAALAAHIKPNSSLIDIGCGAGFPTLPLALLRDDITILAIDSTEKRIRYVAAAAELLGLENVKAVAMRAEVGGQSPEYREKFDYATARAVAEMRILAELALPFVKVGGRLIAMKGKNAENELSAAKRAIAMLGGRGARLESVTLKASGLEPLTHPLITVEKQEKTPKGYPRAFAQISKKPL